MQSHKIICNLDRHLTIYVDKSVERFRPLNANLPVGLRGDRCPVDLALVQVGVHSSKRQHTALLSSPNPDNTKLSWFYTLDEIICICILYICYL